MVGKLPITEFPHSKKKKKTSRGEPWVKSQTSGFYHVGPIFDVKKIIAQDFAHETKSCAT